MNLPRHVQALPKGELKRLKALTALEAEVRSKGFRSIAGVDEAGRGPLAGPVVAAACSIPEGVFFPGINDSKLLTALKRETLYHQITSHPAVHFGIGVVDHVAIDRINILQATFQAMREAVAQMTVEPDYLLVDGQHTFTDKIPSLAVIKGDLRSHMIAAASILAKHRRDQIMIEYDALYPDYGFAAHKGYATEQHRLALAKYGPSPIHRLTFNAIFNEEILPEMSI